MEEIEKILSNIWVTRIINSIIILVLSFILYKLIILFLDKDRSKKNGKFNFFATNKGKTYIKLIKSIVKNVFVIATFFLILQANGIDISAILTGVGLLGVIFGLAIQDWLKDMIRGSSILSDGYFQVGDIVKYNDIEAKVLVIGLKTTKIQDLATSNIISIANRKIEEIQVVSNFIYVKVPMPYEVSLEKAESAIEDIVKLVKENENIKNCVYKGVSELADSCILYLLQVDCNQQFKLQAKRDTLRSILVGLSKHGIEVPYPQIDVHNK